MSYKTCPDCGERVYNLGCSWCNEEAYIAEQERLTDLYYPARTVDEATLADAVDPSVTDTGKPTTRV